MRILLDTQLYLWFLADSPKLAQQAKRQIDEAEDVFVSAASLWEAAIKIGLGRLEVSIEKLIHGIEASGMTELPIHSKHCALVTTLPNYHRDPFDRLSIAQAIYEPLQFLTANSFLQPYSDFVKLT